jgi:hypothetical protein
MESSLLEYWTTEEQKKFPIKKSGDFIKFTSRRGELRKG